MKKFAELQYVRPDMEKIFARVSGDIAVLKEAKNYEEFRNAYMDYVEADTELETSKTVAHIRNTINLLDEFYEAEDDISTARCRRLRNPEKRWAR